MSVTSSHEMLNTNCLNLDAHTIVECDLWWNERNLLVNVWSLFESLKVAWHWIFHHMLQSCSKVEINILTKVKTTLKLCPKTCQWIEIRLWHLDNYEGEIEWPSALDWGNCKTLNMFPQTSQKD
jgi:hypothetical protein